MTQLLEATIEGIHAAMRAGKLSAVELVQFYLDRIAAYDQTGPGLNAIQSLNPAALDEAKRLDARLTSSGMVGPLHGIPVLVKDPVETADLPTTYGSALFKGFMPGRDATVVERLKAAGAIILAKTNMGEFAQGYAGSAFGFCRNPYDPTRNPSGSSAGTGVGVSANFATIGLGEDSGGSIRGPAALNNLFGLRPTPPLVSKFGMMPAVPTRDTLGPLARTARDAAIMLDVLAGYDPRYPPTAACVGYVPPTYTSFLLPDGLVGLRLGVIRQPLARDTELEPEEHQQVQTVIDHALSDLAEAGAEIADPVEMRLYGGTYCIPSAYCFWGGRGEDGWSLNWQVPIDDESHWKFTFNYSRTRALDKEGIRRERQEMTPDHHPLRNKANRYLQDRDSMKTECYSGIGMVFQAQDLCVTEGAGPIQDRSQEHLTPWDIPTVAQRTILLKALKDIADGRDPPNVLRDPRENHFPRYCAIATTVPQDTDWKAYWRDMDLEYGEVGTGVDGR